MANNIDTKITMGIKLKYLFEKISEYDTNHMFHLLDETPLQELIELKDMKNQFGNITVNTTWELML